MRWQIGLAAVVAAATLAPRRPTAQARRRPSRSPRSARHGERQAGGPEEQRVDQGRRRGRRHGSAAEGDRRGARGGDRARPAAGLTLGGIVTVSDASTSPTTPFGVPYACRARSARQVLRHDPHLAPRARQQGPSSTRAQQAAPRRRIPPSINVSSRHVRGDVGLAVQAIGPRGHRRAVRGVIGILADELHVLGLGARPAASAAGRRSAPPRGAGRAGRRRTRGSASTTATARGASAPSRGGAEARRRVAPFTRTRLSVNGRGARQPLVDRRRAAVARRAHGGDDAVVVLARPDSRRTRPRGRRSAAAARAASRRARSCSCASSTRRQIRVRERVRVDLPAVGHQRADLVLGDPALAEVAQLEVEHAGPAEPAQHRPRVRVLRQVAVVEGDHDRLARERAAVLPRVERLPQRDRVVAGRAQRAHLGREARPRRPTAPGSASPAGAAETTWYMRIGTGIRRAAAPRTSAGRRRHGRARGAASAAASRVAVAAGAAALRPWRHGSPPRRTTTTAATSDEPPARRAACESGRALPVTVTSAAVAGYCPAMPPRPQLTLPSPGSRARSCSAPARSGPPSRCCSPAAASAPRCRRARPSRPSGWRPTAQNAVYLPGVELPARAARRADVDRARPRRLLLPRRPVARARGGDREPRRAPGSTAARR